MFFHNFHRYSVRLEFLRNFSTLRTNIALNLSKNFENVSLVEFPLKKSSTFNLSEFIEIENAHKRCHEQHLDDNPNYYPSVTTILNQTLSPESLAALKKWETEKIRQFGLEGFERYRKELFSRGRWLHNNIRTYLETKDSSRLKISTKTQENMWKSIEMILPNINRLYASEMIVYHPILKFRGILDTLAEFHEIPALIEWKTSEKLRPTIAHTYDNPLQAVAYYSCLQFNDNYQQQKLNLDPPSMLAKEILLIIAYEDGTKANIHIIEPSLSLTIWRKFLQRLERYWSVIGKSNL
ncbi:mitochondrial genome maintenance exonuclease 1-like [Dermatophagoides pteronyssinus]|uniref:Mitochondrial genome maintenance exonuclease 1 n=1 Tax=Dermatophagoides pteronyssinus TaxID=6956 RepID=A0A6P6Y936_DERPT|nr:mitochondrial genome maintenance exonuclease 1-like [Dermatophagoides pteronyssinus]